MKQESCTNTFNLDDNIKREQSHILSYFMGSPINSKKQKKKEQRDRVHEEHIKTN